MTLKVSGLDEASRYIGTATHVLSVIDPEDAEFLPPIPVPRGHHLILTCHDVDSETEARSREARMPGSRCVAPTKEIVRRGLEFAKLVPSDAFLLIHCGQGVSRSPALAFAILCQDQPKVKEAEVLRQVIAIRPEASPNELIVKFADELLNRKGRMVRAIERLNALPG